MTEPAAPSPESVLTGFFAAMCAWEQALIERHAATGGAFLASDENKDATRAQLQGIYANYLTPKERKTGRAAALSFGTPLEFDPDREQLASIELDLDGKKATIETVYSTYAELRRRYTLKMTKDGWRIDRREDYSAYRERWANVVL